MSEYESPEWHPAFEEYCETIYELGEDDLDVIQARIAERMDVSRPAVSEMVKRLESEGLIEAGRYEPQRGGGIFITGEKGEIRAGGKTEYRSVETGGEWRPAPDRECGQILDDWVAWIEGGPEHRCSGASGSTAKQLCSYYMLLPPMGAATWQSSR